MAAPALHPSEDNVARAAELIRSGGVVAYPTETVFGLGADPKDEDALRFLFDIKGRPADQPVLLLIADLQDVTLFASAISPAAELLIDRFWPGPLTLIFPANPGLSEFITSGSKTVALRQASPGTALDLVQACGHPITSTSANRSGEPPATTAKQASALLPPANTLVLSGQCLPDASPSTIVDTTGGAPRVVRAGAIPEDEIIP